MWAVLALVSLFVAGVQCVVGQSPTDALKIGLLCLILAKVWECA